jgi:hypothetical protein
MSSNTTVRQDKTGGTRQAKAEWDWGTVRCSVASQLLLNAIHDCLVNVVKYNTAATAKAQQNIVQVKKMYCIALPPVTST